MNEEEKWKLEALEKITNELLERQKTLEMAYDDLVSGRSEVAKEIKRIKKDEARNEPLIKTIGSMAKQVKKSKKGLTFTKDGNTYLVKKPRLYVPDGRGSHRLMEAEEIVTNDVVLGRTMKKYPRYFTEITTAEEVEDKAKKAATKKPPAKKSATTKKTKAK